MMGPFMSSVHSGARLQSPFRARERGGERPHTNILGINPSFFLFAVGELPGFDEHFLRGPFFAGRVVRGVFVSGGSGALALLNFLFAFEAECLHHCVVCRSVSRSVAVVVRELRAGARHTAAG